MNHSQRKYEPALSDIFSSDVLHSILSSPTDTLQALNEAVDDTNVKNVTQSTKVKLQKFYNNDFVVRFNGSFADVRSDLRKLFSMDREGATDYVIYDVPNGRMAFRLADHNANGNNFEQDSANTNISVYVAIREFDVPSSKTSYTEFKITEETFNKNRELTIRAIIDAVRNALNGQEFNIPESIAQRKDYPITESKINSNMKQNKKTITEAQLRDIVAESVKNVLNERTDFWDDGQWKYQWINKDREEKAYNKGLRAGAIPDNNGVSWHMSKNDAEREKKAGEYDGYERHSETIYSAIAKAKIEIYINGIWSCLRKFKKQLTYSALQKILDEFKD